MLPAWNLNDLFTSLTDPRLEDTFQSVTKEADAFAAKYRGGVEVLARNASKMARALLEFEDLQLRAAKPAIFAGLLFAQDASNEKHGAFLQKAQLFASEISNKVIFFELEMMDLRSQTLSELARDGALANYRNYLHKIEARKPHRLSEEQETLLNELSLTGRLAFLRLFDQEFSHKKFNLKKDGKIRQVSESEVLNMLTHQSRPARKAALDSLVTGLRGESWRLTYIFNTLAGEKQSVDRRRRFESPESARHLENEVDQRSVETLAEVLQGSYALVQRYYKLKAQILGIKDFALHDRYAPVRGKAKNYSFDQAKKLVLGAFAKFSPEFLKFSEDFFNKRWIDAAKREGKRGGAFCSYVTPDLHPYVFINFQGSLRDVFTPAHELGHATHACLMRGQNYMNFDSPLTIAESASTFAELLLFDHMKSSIKSKEEMVKLLIFKIDSIIATVYRQISMYLFEKDFHTMRASAGELSNSQICAIWQKRQKQLYGNALKLTEGSEVLWSYIPHFLHTPFYVYAYSYGELLALVFYDSWKREGAPFAQKYSEFLALGSSERPDVALHRLGIDVNVKTVWQRGVEALGSMVAEVAALKR